MPDNFPLGIAVYFRSGHAMTMQFASHDAAYNVLDLITKGMNAKDRTFHTGDAVIALDEVIYACVTQSKEVPA